MTRVNECHFFLLFLIKMLPVFANSRTFASSKDKQDNKLKIRERKLIMTVLFMVSFVVAVCIAEAVKVNNDINLGVK